MTKGDGFCNYQVADSKLGVLGTLGENASVALDVRSLMGEPDSSTSIAYNDVMHQATYCHKQDRTQFPIDSYFVKIEGLSKY